ncbi:MAG: BatA domain-containing protein [Planctomycetota bacterium]
MSFLTPALTAGALLIAAPIILHLVMRREPTPVVFPALRFVQARRSTNQTRMRLRHWLLLALRCLAVAMLALALARPVLRGSGLLGADSGRLAVAVVVDNSPRMGLKLGDETRLDRAQALGGWLLEQLPADSQVALVARGATRARPLAKRWGDRDSAAAKLMRMESSARDRPLASAVRDAVDLLEEREDDRRELYVFTDQSAAAWDAETLGEVNRQLDRLPGLKLQVVDVGARQSTNRGLGALSLSSATPVKGEALEIAAPVLESSAEGGAASGSVTVELWIDQDGTAVKRSQTLVNLESGDDAVLTVASLEEGVHQGYVTIAGADPLPADDRRYFTVRVEPPRPILLVGPNRASTLFVAEALAPFDAAAGEAAAYQPARTTTDELLSTRLADYQSVWLLDPPPLEAAAWRRLDDYARSGGSVLTALGGRAKSVAMNRPEPQAVLGARLEYTSRDVSYLSPARYNHPSIAPLAPLAEAIPWTAFPVFKYWAIEQREAGVSLVAPLANGDAAILARTVGRGKAVTLTTPLSDPASPDPWNTLPTGVDPWPFLALTRSLADYLSGVGEWRYNYQAGEPAVLPAPAGGGLLNYVLRLPGEEAIKVSQPSGAEIVVGLTDTPGNYRVEADGQRFDGGFSVNSAGSIGRLERIADGDLRTALGDDRVAIARQRKELARQVDLGRVGRELYPWLIVLVAIALGGEHLLSNRFYDQPG